MFNVVTEFEEQYLINVFTGDSFEPNLLYEYDTSSGIIYDRLIEHFVDDILDGDGYKNWDRISDKQASILLRQMAMFRKENGRKEQVNTSTEAKYYTTELLTLLGNKTEYYTNVDSIEYPHDKPGFVEHNSQMYSHHDSICFIAINAKNFLFMEQTWNFGGE